MTTFDSMRRAHCPPRRFSNPGNPGFLLIQLLVTSVAEHLLASVTSRNRVLALTLRVCCAVLCLLASVTLIGAASAQSVAASSVDPRPGVLMIFGNQGARPSNTSIEAALRAELEAALPGRVDVFAEPLDLESSRGMSYDESLAKDLRAKYRNRNLRAIVTVGPAALRFMLAYRRSVAPRVPMVYTGVSAETVGELAPPADVGGVSIDFALVRTLNLAVSLHPQARKIVMPVGASDLDRLWKRRVGAVAEQIRPPIPVEFREGLSFPELQRDLAELDAGAIIFVPVYRADTEGRMFLGTQLVDKLSQLSRAPIYTPFEDGIGVGAIGGYVVDYAQQGKLAGEPLIRILEGATPNAIPRAVSISTPTFDARQLGRWRIDETLLPQGSVVKYRQASIVDRYRWHIAAALLALLLQAIVITGLLIERRRRRSAELETRKRFTEMAHMNRSVSIGVLSASIAHEINQPLGAILNNAGAAELLMAQRPPALKDIVEILGDVKRDTQRVNDVMARIRVLLGKRDFELRDVDLNRSVAEVMDFLAPEASIRGVVLQPELDATLRSVFADIVQLQQILVNLLLNGMDAMRDNAAGTRRLVLRTTQASDHEAEVTVTDTGQGICAGSVAPRQRVLVGDDV